MELKGRQDRWRLLLPDDFIPKEINDKYAQVLQRRHSFIYKPIDLLNESIQRVEVLGFNNSVVMQQQTHHGNPIRDNRRVNENNFMHSSTEVPYRSSNTPIAAIDKTLNIDFRHEAGFLNYFLMFESFFYQYARDTKSLDMPYVFPIEIFNEDGEVYCRIMLYDPVMEGMDMLGLDFTQPIAQSQVFRTVFKYSNIDFQFILDDAVTHEDVDNPLTKADYIPAEEYQPYVVTQGQGSVEKTIINPLNPQ